MKLVVSNELLKRLLNLPAGNRLLDQLRYLFEEIPGSDGQCKVALRMTRGPSQACIDFHCDGAYASGTVQIALNSTEDYEGGRLTYFVSDRLQVLESRPSGSVVQHPPRVLHAVTAMKKGTRKSLFVVDHSNGLGERGVVDVTEAHVNAFLASGNENDGGAGGRKRRGSHQEPNVKRRKTK